ncbi:MAG: hypothetical protein QM673_11715 [Gordonia sp. (in: high G+C Gram-positive bacteria)]
MTTDTDDTAPNNAIPRPADMLRRIEDNQRVADEWLDAPSNDIYRLLWQVCGAWETVIEEVRFFRYVIEENPPTEPPFVHPSGGTVAKDLRRIAKWLNLRLPSETEWSRECKRAKVMRDDLGHMLHFRSVTGESPNQVVTLLRVPFCEPNEMRVEKGSVGRWDPRKSELRA